ncbi:aminotransferase-like domain-containing protein [Aureimonas frigidaquae]|uniref:Transcriptional regulator n=1 Tax=Aureimonas frigidaquae TaxID=424757 RepID=A0A0P0Z417_9HYPH|nr:PLP-dependent aminotransferase family protein [Aureimonas frigidaquae]BAT28746.1 transcriptional regulator [Aureimonas frigidaquae]
MGKIDDVVQAVRGRIVGGLATPGTQLPSIRRQAQQHSVSVSTVVEAYERLAGEGLVYARPGAGFYVAGQVQPSPLRDMAPRRARNVDPLWISRQSLDAPDGAMMPGCGWLPADWMFVDGMRRAMRKVGRAPASALTDYATPLGHNGLRHVLSRRLQDLGIAADSDRIVLTESGTQALDLVCRLLLRPGDRVIVDDPCYFNFHALLKAHRVEVFGVPWNAEGPDLSTLDSLCRAHGPGLYVTNSAIHNPTGATLAPDVAHRLLKLCESHGLVVVEDDIFGDFEPVPAPRLAALDGLSRVVVIGSFSKSISASVRCGYIAARADWIDPLVDMKIATGFGGGRMAAELLYAALTDGALRRHKEAVRRRLSAAMERTAQRLADLGIEPWLMPRAGMFLWCRMPQGVHSGTLASLCLADGVVLAPGNAFSLSGTMQDYMRFNVAQMGEERVFTSLARNLAAARDQAGSGDVA